MELQLPVEAIAIVAPIVAGVLQALKLTAIPHKLLPVIALPVGIVVAWLIARDFTPTVWITGLVAALVSQGLYDQIKKGKEVIDGK